MSEQTIVLLMLTLGFLGGVAVTICVYSAVSRRRMNAIYSANANSNAECEALRMNSVISAYRWIRLGNPDMAASMLAIQICAYSSFVSSLDQQSHAIRTVMDRIRGEFERDPKLRQCLDDMAKQRDGKSVAQMLMELEGLEKEAGVETNNGPDITVADRSGDSV